MYLDVYKNGELIETLSLSASKRLYTVGRQEGVADILLTHASVSREQATITISASGSVVVTDLGSAQGTYISGKSLAPKKPHALAPGRSLVFGKSTRVFKLREASDGFMAAAAAPPPAVSEPLTEGLLALLRGQVPSSALALRPDGFARLSELAASPSLAAFHPTAASVLELAAAPAREGVLEVRAEEGEPLVRALSGHALTSRVDPSLRLRRLDLVSLGAGAMLYHGAKFSEWNLLRARGIGGAAAGGGVLPPIRLSTVAPAKRGGARCDVVVVLSAARLHDSGARVWIDATATDAAGAGGEDGQQPPPLALVAAPPVAGGTLGVYLFDRIYSARDGADLMSREEIEPIRVRREVEQAAAAAAAALARRKSAEEFKEEVRLEEEEAAVERYNPYLSHLELEPAPKPSNRSAAAVVPVRKRQRAEEESGSGW